MPYPDNFSSGRLDDAQGRDDAEAELSRDNEDRALERATWLVLERARKELLSRTAHNQALNDVLSEAIDTITNLRDQFEMPNRWVAQRGEAKIYATSQTLAMIAVLGKFYNSPSVGWSRARADGWTVKELPL